MLFVSKTLNGCVSCFCLRNAVKRHISDVTCVKLKLACSPHSHDVATKKFPTSYRIFSLSSQWIVFTRNRLDSFLFVWRVRCAIITLSSFFRPFSKWTWVSRCLLNQRMMEVVVTTGAIGRAKLQSNHHQQQNSFWWWFDWSCAIITINNIKKRNTWTFLSTGLLTKFLQYIY